MIRRLGPTGRLRQDELFFAVQDLRPVETDLRVVLFDQANRLFVQRRPADADARGRAKPVQDSRAFPPARIVDDVGVLVTTLVSREAQRRQGLFPFHGSGRRGFRRRRPLRP